MLPDMTDDEVLEIFRSENAILDGHFILSSGLHSPVFLQKALVYRSPSKTERLCRALADKVRAWACGLHRRTGPRRHRAGL